jgi:Fe-Mn family superoxide dismutase
VPVEKHTAVHAQHLLAADAREPQRRGEEWHPGPVLARGLPHGLHRLPAAHHRPAERVDGRYAASPAGTEHLQHTLTARPGTPFEAQEAKALVIEFARDPTKAYGFNVASMAFNNHFFFNGINSNPDVVSQPSVDLTNQIRNDFSSLETLRETFLATAEAMFGPGFVWLVQTNDTTLGNLRILPTYLAGSPLSGAHHRRQSHDLNTHNADSYQELNAVGAFGGAAKKNNAPKKPLGGVDVVPLLCVNTWEHVWLRDYGVRGKRQFLEAWWNKINWDVVGQNATIAPRQSQRFQYI